MEVVYQFRPSVSTIYISEKLGAFTFPALTREKVKRMPKQVSAVLATSNDKPVGLVLAVDLAEVKKTRIVSLFVHPSYRQKGIARGLVGKLQGEKGYMHKELLAFYRTNWKSVEIVEKLAKSLSWSAPKVEMSILNGQVSNLVEVYKGYEDIIIDQYTIRKWEDIDKEESLAIQQIFVDEGVSKFLDPFMSPHNNQKNVSSVLFFKNQVLGWFVVNMIAEKSYEYTSLYVSKRCQNYKISLVMMKSVIMNHYRYAADSRFLIMVRKENLPMTRFLNLLSRKSKVEMKHVMRIDYHM